MAILVKFFARLREDIDQDSLEIDAHGVQTVADVWSQATGKPELPANIYCAINHEHSSTSDQVSDGDEVAFFPRITGGQP